MKNSLKISLIVLGALVVITLIILANKYNNSYQDVYSKYKLEVVKEINSKSSKYETYLEIDNRTIYLSSRLAEVYYNDGEVKNTLKFLLTNVFQSVDDIFKNITDDMNNTETFRDGGTKVYKSKLDDITIVKCNTVSGNRDIFIGDYEMSFDNELMCK